MKKIKRYRVLKQQLFIIKRNLNIFTLLLITKGKKDVMDVAERQSKIFVRKIQSFVIS